MRIVVTTAVVAALLGSLCCHSAHAQWAYGVTSYENITPYGDGYYMSPYRLFMASISSAPAGSGFRQDSDGVNATGIQHYVWTGASAPSDRYVGTITENVSVAGNSSYYAGATATGSVNDTYKSITASNASKGDSATGVSDISFISDGSTDVAVSVSMSVATTAQAYGTGTAASSNASAKADCSGLTQQP